MFNWLTNVICFAFRMWHEFELNLYDDLCYNESDKNSHSHHLFGRSHNEDKSSSEKHFRFAWLLLLPAFGLSFLIGLYGLYKISRFSEKSLFGSMKTAESVAKNINLTGKVAIVTGASDGLGKETTKVLLKQGACVIMGVRDREKGEEARKCIIDYLTSKNYQPLHTLEKRIIMLSLDLSSLQSVRDFVINFNKLGLPLHYLINNGGIMATDHYELSKDGIESQFQVNYLSHYYLTRLLTPILQQTPNSRVINLSSVAHNSAPKPFSEWINRHALLPQGPLKEEYSSQGFTEYGISKACMILFAREYANRYNEIISVSIHPGQVDTKLWNENKWFKRFRFTLLKFLKLFPGEFKTVEQGAGTIMYCIVTPNDEIKSGQYYRDCSYAQDQLRKDFSITFDNKQDSQLWNLSENLIKKAGFDFNL